MNTTTIQPLAPDVVALLNGAPAVDAARMGRARRVPLMLAAEEKRSAELVADLTSGRPDSTHAEWLWQEIERLLENCNRQERMDALEDMTLLDVIKRMAEHKARQEYADGIIGDTFPSTG